MPEQRLRELLFWRAHTHTHTYETGEALILVEPLDPPLKVSITRR